MGKFQSNQSIGKIGCRTYEKTFQKLEELEADLFQHIHLENNILFLRYEISSAVVL